MLIDFISDLHMEINRNLRLKKQPGGDVLILAGDITCMRFFKPGRTDAEARSMQNRFREFISGFCEDYKHIFYLPGNHEYYNHYFHSADSDFRDIIETYDPRLKFVNNQSTSIDGVTLIFSTLWTNFNNDNYWNKKAAEDLMNDYRVISQYKDGDISYDVAHSFGFNRNRLSPEVIYNFHQASFNFIKSAYEKRVTDKVVIATHHAPSFQSHNVKRFGPQDDLTPAYCSEYGHWIADSAISYWLHGHTHADMDYVIGDTRILGNMYGYEMYDFIPNRGWKKEIKRIEI